jgi:hypothetical protein
MRRNLFALVLLMLLLAGCATSKPPSGPPVPGIGNFPADAFIIQRAMFKARGMEFPLNGYMALSKTGGKRLVLTESFGMVMADLLVKPDGKIVIIKSSRLFPARYIRRLMSADVACIFGGWPKLDCPVSVLDTNHFLIDRGGYKLDLRILEIKPGPQNDSLFEPDMAKGK